MVCPVWRVGHRMWQCVGSSKDVVVVVAVAINNNNINNDNERQRVIGLFFLIGQQIMQFEQNESVNDRRDMKKKIHDRCVIKWMEE